MKKAVAIILIFFLTVAGFSTRAGSQETDWSKPLLLSVTKAPDLPSGLRGKPGQSTVMIRAKINARGYVDSTEIVRSEESSILNSYLQKWISTWRYIPKLDGNRTTEAFTVIAVRVDTNQLVFETPQPVDRIMELPDPIVESLLGDNFNKGTAQPPPGEPHHGLDGLIGVIAAGTSVLQ